MIFDMQSLFSDAQAVVATVRSTNTIDLGTVKVPQNAKAAPTRDIGKGSPDPILIQVVEGFNNLTSLTIALQVDDNTGFASPKTVVDQVVLLADLVAGKRIPPMYIPEGVDERYVSLLYTVTGTAPTLGKITAGLVFGHHNWKP